MHPSAGACGRRLHLPLLTGAAGLLDCLAVGIGGFLGTVLRYGIGLLPQPAGSVFPLKTLCINVLGAFVLGAVAASAARNRSLDPRLVLMLRVGVCGGFTTFSTFAYESAGLLQSGHTAAAAAYVLASLLLGVLAVFAAQLLFG